LPGPETSQQQSPTCERKLIKATHTNNSSFISKVKKKNILNKRSLNHCIKIGNNLYTSRCWTTLRLEICSSHLTCFGSFNCSKNRSEPNNYRWYDATLIWCCGLSAECLWIVAGFGAFVLMNWLKKKKPTENATPSLIERKHLKKLVPKSQMVLSVLSPHQHQILSGIEH